MAEAARAWWVAAWLAALVLFGLAYQSLLAPVAPADRREALMALHAELLPDRPRPLGSGAAAEARAAIALALRRAGCIPREQRAWSCAPGRCGFVHNLWCRLGPENGDAIVGMAHTDSVGAGPGAGDDGAGVVAWVDTVRSLQQAELKHPFVLMLTDGEENGLFGARVFVDDPPFDNPIKAVINLEARGTSGASLLFEIVGTARTFLDADPEGFRISGSALYVAIYDRMPNLTDVTILRRAGIPAVNHAFIGTLPHYHTPLDDRAHLDPDTLVHHADAARGWVAALDAQQPTPSDADVVFMDFAGLGLLRWPAALGLPLSIAGLLGWLGLLWVERAVVGGRNLVRAGLFFGLGGAALAVAGHAVGVFVDAFAEGAYWGHPAPLRIAAWGLAGAGLACGSWACPSQPARWHAVAGWFAVMGVAAAAGDARFSVLFLPVTALALGVRLLAWRWPHLARVGLLATGAVWFPLALGLEDALTLASPAVVTLPAWIALSGWLWLVPSLTRRFVAPLLGVGLVCVSAGYGATSPPFTKERPQPVNLLVVQDPAGTASLTVTPLVGALPEAFVGGSEAAGDLPLTSWGTRLALPPLHLPGPRVTWRSDTAAHLVPGRLGRWLAIEVPAHVQVQVDGVPAQTRRGRLELVGIPPAGVLVTLSEPVNRLRVAERADGLPPTLHALLGDRGLAVPIHEGDGTVVVVDVDATAHDRLRGQSGPAQSGSSQ